MIYNDIIYFSICLHLDEKKINARKPGISGFALTVNICIYKLYKVLLLRLIRQKHEIHQ